MPCIKGPSLDHLNSSPSPGRQTLTAPSGTFSSPQECRFDTFANSVGGTWVWDGISWMQVPTPTPPPARGYHAMVYDAARGKTLLFGGINFVRFGDTWEFDGANRNDLWVWNGSVWSDLGVQPGSPSPRFGSAMVYDSDRDTFVLFGGSGGLGDTWEFDGDTLVWTEIVVPGPGTSRDHSMVYDSHRDRSASKGSVSPRPVTA